ncbi:hypothetical protein FGO68_gene647 [Halteria grandinella]|uniref:protein-tyrosine-phosphatase n=1 Tax=Halteria grandinella TaxID=5974 RepID=A0A8J8NIL0_HALGN|nr:hypothetical protein FGO68_gene647 [Halteria grandinella]
MDVCACDIQCQIALREINLFEVYPGIVMGPYQAAFKTKQLVEMGVTHVLNVTCREYTKRPKYFKYLDVAIYDTHSEDAKKNFRITNRFIEEARKSTSHHGDCKVLVHSVQGKSRAATFILAYLIGREKMKLKDGLALLRQFVPEVEPNETFMQQLAEYDLEILSNKF